LISFVKSKYILQKEIKQILFKWGFAPNPTLPGAVRHVAGVPAKHGTPRPAYFCSTPIKGTLRLSEKITVSTIVNDRGASVIFPATLDGFRVWGIIREGVRTNVRTKDH
jgi:hypothetical protein